MNRIVNDSSTQTEKGICTYAVDYLFSKINRQKDKVFTIKISYLEIYNEQVIDLLSNKTNSNNNNGLMIVEDPTKGVLVPDLTEIAVNNSTQVYNHIINGNSRRTKGATSQNQFSSRSHAILEINIEQCNKNIIKDDILISKMLLVDLAGSERGGKEKGKRREEGANINRSLLALGNCINILSDKSKQTSFVPYRDSKLTRLLKDSLGGNIVTIMIACVSPSPLTYEETHSTLKYASSANKIEKKVTRNVKEVAQTTAQYREMISSLRTEIGRLKEIIREQHLKIKNKNKYIEEEIKSNFNSCSYGDNNSNSNNNNKTDRNFDLDSDDGYFNFDNENTLTPIDGSPHSNHNNNNINLNNNNDFHSSSTSITLNNNNNITNNNINEESGIIINFSIEIYDNILNNNLNDLTDEQFNDLEKKLNCLYYDKVHLEEQLKHGVKTTEITEKYTQIKHFYERFIDILNEKLIENTEQNMTIKFKLKELLESTEQNNSNLTSVQSFLQNEHNIDEISRLTCEKRKYKLNLEKESKDINKYRNALHKNLKIKTFLKKLLVKFISNTQINECRDLKSKFTSLSNEKRELEIKTKKYQEYFNQVLKEKEKKTHEIFHLNNELEKTKVLLSNRDKKISELERKISEIESMNSNIFTKQFQSPLTKSMLNFIEDCDSRSSSANNKSRKIHHRSTSIKNLSHYSNSNVSLNGNGQGSGSNNNYLSVNLNKKVPTVTAFIKGGDIYSHDVSLANSISNLKYNLTVKNSSKSPKQKSVGKVNKVKTRQKAHKITPSTSLAKKPGGSNNYVLFVLF